LIEQIYCNTYPIDYTPQPNQTTLEEAELELNITLEPETRDTADNSTIELDRGMNSVDACSSRHLDTEQKAWLFSLCQKEMLSQPANELSSKLYRIKVVRR
jgi:hypothetical protein